VLENLNRASSSGPTLWSKITQILLRLRDEHSVFNVHFFERECFINRKPLLDSIRPEGKLEHVVYYGRQQRSRSGIEREYASSPRWQGIRFGGDTEIIKNISIPPKYSTGTSRGLHPSKSMGIRQISTVRGLNSHLNSPSPVFLVGRERHLGSLLNTPTLRLACQQWTPTSS